MNTGKIELINQIVKWSAVAVAAGEQLLPFLPDQVTGWAVVAFMTISALKDKLLIPIGDKLDDGEFNGSFKG